MSGTMTGKQQTESDQDLLIASETAALLRISPGALANMRYRGSGPRFVTLGTRSIRYRRADVDAWLEASARTQTGD